MRVRKRVWVDQEQGEEVARARPHRHEVSEDERERAHRRVVVVMCGEKVRKGEGGRNDGARIVLSLHRSHLTRMCGRRVRVRASEG